MIKLKDEHMFVCFAQSLSYDSLARINIIVKNKETRDLERLQISLAGCFTYHALIKKDYLSYVVKECWDF